MNTTSDGRLDDICRHMRGKSDVSILLGTASKDHTGGTPLTPLVHEHF